MNPPSSKTQRKRRLFIAAAGFAFIVLIWLALAGRSLFDARAAAVGGLDTLTTIRDDFALEQLESGELAEGLSAASAEFSDARAHLRAGWVSPLRIIPWLGRQIRSADALAGSASISTEFLAAAADTAREIAEDARRGVADKAEAALRMRDLTTGTREMIAGLDLGPTGGLTASLADARRQFDGEMRSADDRLADAETALTGIAEFLTGPTTYLLLSANTSEMRVGSGRTLVVGPIQVHDGEIQVGDLLSPEELLLPENDAPITDAQLAENWAELAPTTDLRNLGFTPRFEVTASLAVDMWESATGRRPDGALLIDPLALQGVLSAGGSVSVDGLTIDAANVLSHIVLDQYWEDDTQTRRDRQQHLASQALSTATGPTVDLIDLVRSLESAVAGRHILAWADSPVEQAAWEILGIEGAVAADSLMISVMNEGFNKLDTFLKLEATAQSREVSGGHEIDLELAIHNTAGPELPDYVLGPYPSQGVDAGTYRGILIVNFPGNATQIEVEGPGVEVVSGRDGPTQVFGLRIQVDPTKSNTYRIFFTLPTGSEQLTVMPSARVPPIRWSFDAVEWSDVSARTLDLETGDYGIEPAWEAPTLELRQNSSAVPPSPYVRLSSEGDEVVITWPVTSPGVDVVLWERLGAEDWRMRATAISPASSVNPLRLPVDGSVRPYCYRSSLAENAATFSSTSCVSPEDS